jgi:hypothetical protein
MQRDLLTRGTYRLCPDDLTGATLSPSNSWDYYHVSGGTTVTSIASIVIGMQILLEFDTETIITHSASLILPSGEDITAAIGDVYRFVETSEGVWKNVSSGGTSGGGTISDAAYGSGWNGVASVGASQNALYDKIETLADAGDNTNITSLRGLNEPEVGSILIGNANTGGSCGDKNIIIGADGFSNLTSSKDNNVSIGNSNGGEVTGVGNIVMGTEALYVPDTSTSNYSIIIGNAAGYRVLPIDYQDVILIGLGAFTLNDTATNEIVIGSGATGHGSNTCTIGHTDIDDTYVRGILHVEDSGGIKFPASQKPSDDVNTLDDYEEGDFTPTLEFGGGSTGIVYVAQQGRYTKVGNRVYVDIRVKLSSKGTSTGSAVITGLPFQSYNDGLYRCFGYYTENITYTKTVSGFNTPSTSNITLRVDDATVTDAAFSDTSVILITGAYRSA